MEAVSVSLPKEIIEHILRFAIKFRMMEHFNRSKITSVAFFFSDVSENTDIQGFLFVTIIL